MACTSCKVLRFEVDAVKADLAVKTEEVNILRVAQTDCGRMASEIAELQTLVDEQRRHMATHSGKTLDPDIGVLTWLQQIASKSTKSIRELRDEHDKQMAALQATHAYQLAALQQHVQTVTAQYGALYEQHTGMVERAAAAAAEIETLEACVSEQRRHLATVESGGGAVDANIGLLPLMRKGMFESSEDMQRIVDAAVSQRTSALDAQFDADMTTARLLCNSMSAALDEKCAESERAAADNLVLVEQLQKCRDFTEEWKRKYQEEQREKADLQLLLDANCTANIEAIVQEGEECAEKLAQLTKEKELVEHARDALLKSVRHWQTEAKNTTEELVAALANRDALHLKLYTVSAEKQTLEDKVERLEETVESQKLAGGFVLDVFELVQKYQAARKEGSVAGELEKLEQLLLSEEQEQCEEKADKKKKKHKRRGGK